MVGAEAGPTLRGKRSHEETAPRNRMTWSLAGTVSFATCGMWKPSTPCASSLAATRSRTARKVVELYECFEARRHATPKR